MSAVRDDAANSGAYPASTGQSLRVADSPPAGAQVPANTLAAESKGLALSRLISTRVVPFVSHQLQFVGRSGVTGLALLIFSVVCFLSANAGLHGRLAELQSQLAGAQHLQASQLKAGLDLTPGARLKTLAAKLSGRGDLPVITERIVAQAAAAGLALDSGSYEVDVTQSAQIIRARLTFPVHGSYPNVRKFVDGTLSAVPGAAVDGLRLERKEIAATDVDAVIRFAVYLRNSP